jgi:hypothetical protein
MTLSTAQYFIRESTLRGSGLPQVCERHETAGYTATVVRGMEEFPAWSVVGD